MCKKAEFTLLESSNLISRKIWMIEKSWNFQNVRTFKSHDNFMTCVCTSIVLFLASYSRLDEDHSVEITEINSHFFTKIRESNIFA